MDAQIPLHDSPDSGRCMKAAGLETLFVHTHAEPMLCCSSRTGRRAIHQAADLQLCRGGERGRGVLHDRVCVGALLHEGHQLVHARGVQRLQALHSASTAPLFQGTRLPCQAGGACFLMTSDSVWHWTVNGSHCGVSMQCPGRIFFLAMSGQNKHTWVLTPKIIA